MGMLACKHEPLVTAVPDPTPTNPIDTSQVGVPCDPDSVYFENQVLPILVSNCTESTCHNAIDQREGIVLTSYDNLLLTVKKVTSTDWSQNELMEVLLETDADKVMPPPPNAPLSADQINLIGRWVQQRAKNNACNPGFGGCNTQNMSFSADIAPILAQRCTGCHSGTSLFGGVDLANYEGAKTVALNGKLYTSITRSTNWMPKNAPKLDACTTAKIKSWIDAGAPNN
jgi:uncharacterized membrane protein